MRRLWEAWKRFGKRVADLQVRALLIFFYYFIFSLFALAIRWISDPLGIKPDAPKGWLPKNQDQEGAAMQAATRQF